METLISEFSIKDLVAHNYQSGNGDEITAYEVMDIIANKCYGGLQVFYNCRPIIAKKKKENPFKNDSPFVWDILIGVSKNHNEIGWQKFRQDELTLLDPYAMQIIKGITP